MKMDKYVWLAELLREKVEWKCVTMVHGVEFAIDYTGIVMLESSADNLDTQINVGKNIML